MNINPKIGVSLLLILAAFMTGCSPTGTSESHVIARNTEVNSLRCRGMVNPEGMDEAVLSWKIATKDYGVTQSAWEIEIASSERMLKKGKADVWSSGKKLSDQQINIRPENANLQRGVQYWWRVRIWNGNDEATSWSEPAYFSLGPVTKQEWQAKWITSEWEENSPMPYFRKVFNAKKNATKPSRAIIYLSGLGCSDLYFNGKLVDETRVLDPAQTNYEQYALYSTFDVTDKLKNGENCIGVMIGEGWYSQGKVWGPSFSYGNPILCLQMEITYDDGTKSIIGTDESWTWHPGPILSSNLYAGEVYDANKEIKGWAQPKADCSTWKKAEIAKGIIPEELRPQVMEPIRLQQEIDPVDLWQDAEGNWIFDFGVNVAAIPSIKVNQPKGTRLRMRMGELLKDDKKSVEYNTTGVAATGVIQTDEYICSGEGVETWTPRFTYHGYRYLELSGAVTEPDKSWIKSVLVHNDVDKRGEFECSDQQINRLHELAVRTMLSNTHGLPTDCPHRERCGWLGDAHAVAPFENFNFDLNNFWMKYLEDISSSSSVFLENTLHQKLYNSEFYFADKQPGIPFMISPGRRLCGVASPDWGTAVVQLPWFTYLYFGNIEPLEKYYHEMKQWVDHIDALTENHIVPYGLGDWCPPEGNATIDCPIPLSSTAFHYYDATIVAKTAEILGKTEDVKYYNDLKQKIGKAFLAKFYDEVNKTFGSQTADAMAIDFGLVPIGDEKSVSDAIVRNMKEKYHDFMHTGIFGLGRIGPALSRNGNGQAAWDMFTKKGENSFEWMWVSADATSLWETLPTNEKSKELSLRGSSLNHPMQGVYDSWFFEDIAGIRPDETGPGFKVTRFDPTMTDQLDWAKASIDSPYGKTVSEWSNKNGVLEWKITIPANASGLVVLPSGKDVSINGSELDLAVYPVSEQREGKSIHRFGSGNYLINIR